MVAIVRIRAAGGVVWRRGAGGPGEIALVHRPRYDDWSLPKGKLKTGEHPIIGAVREVWEETGVRASVGTRLPTVDYPVRHSSNPAARKVVDYWAMKVVSDPGFTSGDEVDAICWQPVPAALARLSYGPDAEVLAAFANLPRPRWTVVLLRPAAGMRASAAKLVALVRCFQPYRLVSATVDSCALTLGRLGDALDLPVELEPDFDQQCPNAGWTRALAGQAGETEVAATVVCAEEGPAAAALSALSQNTLGVRDQALGWVFTFADHGVVAVDELTLDQRSWVL